MEIRREDELVKIFPVELRRMLVRLEWYSRGLEEIRVRVGQPLMFVYGGERRYLHRSGKQLCRDWREGLFVNTEQVQEMMMYLCDYSKYAYARQLRDGFVTLPGGIRGGVAGEWLGEEKSQWGVENPMFLNIRIPGEKKGCAAWVLPYILQEERVLHTLILARPGAGKTTFLRDLLREISMQEWCKSVAVVDERYEIAACQKGVPTNDMGVHCDVYSGVEKGRGCMQAIRTMAPQVIGVDEIGGDEEGEVLAYAMQCGVSIVATMHGGSFGEYQEIIRQKKKYGQLHFQRIIRIKKGEEGKRSYAIYDGEGKTLCANT